MSFVRPFFQWSDGTWVGIALRQSLWLFPLVETIHLLALSLFLGTIGILGLRVFGLAMRQQKIPQFAGDLAPWTIGSLCVAVLSGWCLFASEAFKCYDSIPFRIKMVCLFLAVLYHFTIYRKVTRSETSRVTTGRARLAAVISLLLWFSVGLAGRAIGFL
jgi:uncharacterized protein DUF6644